MVLPVVAAVFGEAAPEILAFAAVRFAVWFPVVQFTVRRLGLAARLLVVRLLLVRLVVVRLAVVRSLVSGFLVTRGPVMARFFMAGLAVVAVIAHGTLLWLVG